MVEGVYLVLDMFDVGVTSNPPPYTVYHEQPRSFADKDHAIVSTVMRATIALGENLGKNDQLKRLIFQQQQEQIRRTEEKLLRMEHRQAFGE